MSKAGDRESAAFWERRLFRNTFTYRGERRVVAGWCVKVQWEKERRTLRLRATGRRDAAEEAREAYAELRRGGWPAVAAWQAARRDRPWVAGHRERRSSLPRVAPRKYVSNLNPGFTRELFAELVHEGITEQVALGTENENEARMRALEFQADLAAGGWAKFRLARSREVTVAVFWEADPMICTYTTLLSLPASAGTAVAAGERARGWRVLVVEPDAAVRRAMVTWLTTSSAVARVVGMASAAEVGAGGEGGWDVAVVNRDQPAAAVRALCERRQGARGAGRVVTHGLFADSDAIFASVSGVSRGYFLRRMAPARLLDPLIAAFPKGAPRTVGEEDRQMRRFFQSTFEPQGPVGDEPPLGFTSRETAVLDLLGRGLSDKEIGRDLGISVWTVHSHLKRIFAKYGVRTRTEAVVRHLQK